MKFFQKLIPDFLNKLDHRLLINKPSIWRTKAHYLLFYSIIIVALVFSVGCFYPRSLYTEVYEKSGGSNLDIYITAGMSIIVILFWSTRLYQYKTKILKWNQFFKTFCIYFFCLFILFTSVFSFHYGSFINRTNLISNFRNSHNHLVNNNFHIPSYFPHYQNNLLEHADEYLDAGVALSKKLHELDFKDVKFANFHHGQNYYNTAPIESYEQLNLIKDYLSYIEKHGVNNKIIRTRADKTEKDINDYVKKRIYSGLDKTQQAFVDKIEDAENLAVKKENFSNSLKKETLNEIISEFENAKKEHSKKSLRVNNAHFASGFLFRYERYIRLRSFIEALSDDEYHTYIKYLQQLYDLGFFSITDELIQYHEITALNAYNSVNDTSQVAIVNRKAKWRARFAGRAFIESNKEKTKQSTGSFGKGKRDHPRVELLSNFFKIIGASKKQAYIDYIHYTEILLDEIEKEKRLFIFNDENTGLEEYVFRKCNGYFKKADEQGRLNRLDSVMFFNYFDSPQNSKSLIVDFYPMIIQKIYFDRFYKEEMENADKLCSMMLANNIVDNKKIEPEKFVTDADLIYKRQFLFHAFDHVKNIRKEAADLNIFLGFILANLFFSLCFSILIFYFSSVERNTVLASLLLLGLFYTLGYFLTGGEQIILGSLILIIYILLTIGLFIIFFRPKYQMKRIKLITTFYIFYSISVQIFLYAGTQSSDLILVNLSILLFTILILFYFSYSFIRYIQLPVRT